MDVENYDSMEEDQPGPSWSRNGWPLIDDDDELTAALDPQQQSIVKPAFEPTGSVASRANTVSKVDMMRAADDSLRARLLIRAYRVRGHMAARLDPLGLAKRDLPADMVPAYHGFTKEDYDRPIFLGGVLGFEWATIREIIATLQANYCGHVGLEYMHISDVEERRFLQDRMEGIDKDIEFTPQGKKAILNKVIEAEEWEKFLARKYVGTKRFGLDGGEAMIPAMEAIIKYGGQYGVREIVYGMAHRGRLNMLANVMAKPYHAIFHEFLGGSIHPDDVGGSGDVKYHLGTSTDREFDGINVHMSLVANPSHLEAVNPVVLGKVRAQQVHRDDLAKHEQVLPVLIHGDAAFAGQGIVWECLGFSGVRGYNTGGCIHFIVNNQIGFTTSPQFARSSPYPSDVSKGVQAPILHVNGDDPEAVTFACKLAIDFRQRFKRDIVIDMWCYRRFGHNEGDEPSFTQPLMYARIRKHPPVSLVYGERLIAERVIAADDVQTHRREFADHLETQFVRAQNYKPNKADWFAGRWSGLHLPRKEANTRRNVHSGIGEDAFDAIARALITIPDSVTVHKTLRRVIKARSSMFASGENFDWATAEALAFGSLVSQGYDVRLSGQDSGRGTFSQRHAVWVDQNDEHKYIPLASLPPGRFEVLDSPLSEYGVLGFEYGYALAEPRALILWEGQFGDFANGAQIMIDQFIATGEAKWLRANGIVMLLPHGFEGQGPEHSSARLERFLQLCAEDNIQVCNITSPANYFHVLRRQMLRTFRKPLIIMTPKSLLRHKSAVSRREDFLGESHFMRLLSDSVPPADEAIKTLVLCSGKIAYDLMEARDSTGLHDCSVVRIEQIYPFPSEALVKRLARMTHLKRIVWAQEEPRNSGAWFFTESLINDSLDEAGHKGLCVSYAGRAASASPATGLASRHHIEQSALVADALGLGVLAEIRRTRKKSLSALQANPERI